MHVSTMQYTMHHTYSQGAPLEVRSEADIDFMTKASGAFVWLIPTINSNGNPRAERGRSAPHVQVSLPSFPVSFLFQFMLNFNYERK